MIPDPNLDFYPSRILNPRVKKATDPGSGSATLLKTASTNTTANVLLPIFFGINQPMTTDKLT
jgi:hypothetical protein